MELHLSSQDYKQMIIWAKKEHPKECCGILWGRADNAAIYINAVEQAPNVASNPLQFFEIDPVTLIRSAKMSRAQGKNIVGYFHSHPNDLGEPSLFDAKVAEYDGMIWLIIAEAKVTAWISVENASLHDKFEPVTLKIIN